ncbi:uncharacterized protein LOC132703517 [Cylas formicarius]|uniref:uncharacterized protein LOC132703517 n=1 Tax=Cylas formicarius TaxID=197179 RepID=UPI002958C8BF|nr:uncharacterized protein LOC132703517 [Cylas formicarius]XP_060528817.1 uncharacterized protein LOC132703517 [Cylas formicarius]
MPATRDATFILTSMVIILNAVSAEVVEETSAKTTKCKVSEFACANGKCIPLNYFCDVKNDCGDSSDEPRYCTRCNRTYLGVVGTTYDLELHRPKEDKIPFICHLTFTAAGDDYGDLIQVTFDSFTLGRFVSFTVDGCPDGALQITEANRPQVGGSWCGTSWGPVIYYSETKSITIHVNLLKLSKVENGYNFDYRMEYKFLKKRSAIVRYGGSAPLIFFNGSAPPTDIPEPDYYLGELIAGTYCSRIFSDCDKKHCRLQSPNFPGIYPRNLTCYYAVRQHEIPPGKHALITVRQPKGQLISIRSQSSLYGTATPRELRVWNACDDVQDYVTVYDGYTTRDAVILKFCGGGEAVPEAVSSGHELLVEFSTSPYGTFLQPAPVQSLHGFQLEVEVKFVDQQTPTFVKQKRNCEFWLRGTNRGILESPIHSLPANTTCLYHLQGMDPIASTSPAPFRPMNPRYPDWRHVGMITPPPRYRVWLSVVKFHAGSSWDPQKPDKICKSYLNVWDGQLWTPSNCEGLYCGPYNKLTSKNLGSGSLLVSKSSSSMSKATKNITLLGRYCREHIPRSCDHSLLANTTRFPRPCSLIESFLTSGDTLTLEFKLGDSTALRPVSFKALYEFVDIHLDGEPYGEGPCSRKFAGFQSDNPQKFRSPGDIFLYGRGGSKNISCIYRFEGQKGERIKLTLTDVRIKRRGCDTQLNKDTDRLECVGNVSATLRVFEVPWHDVPGIPRDCLCGVDKNRLMPFTYISASNVVELRFDVTGMNATDDLDTLFFEGNWKFIRTPACSANLRKAGANGELWFAYPTRANEVNCESSPRVLIPGNNKYLYVKVGGAILKHSSRWSNNNTLRSTTSTGIRCYTSNRIIIHTALYSAIICPQETISRDQMVEVFSEGWKIQTSSPNTVGQMVLDRIEIDRLGRELPRTIVAEFYGKETGTYPVMWLELSKRRDVPPNGLGLFMIKPDYCQYRCPELDACINSSVWCDGREDCPSGIDEALTHCSMLLQLPPLYLFFGALFTITCSLAALYILWRTCRRRPRSILQTRLQSLSSDTAILEEKGVICS